METSDPGQPPDRPPIQAAIFDLDGLLVDSEPLWREAEKLVFRTVGIELTEAMCEETTGLRADEVVARWYREYPWTGSTREEVRGVLVDTVCAMISERAEALPGAVGAVEMLRRSGLALAVASSSPSVLIDAALDRLGLSSHFEVRCSAMDELAGKPDPAVYRTAARRLGVPPAACVAFEDSTPGILSARAAGLYVVAVPDPERRDDPVFSAADLVLSSLEELTLARLGPIEPGA